MEGPRISMRLCKMHCDAVTMCLGFVFRGFRSSKVKECHLARSISAEMTDSFNHYLFVKRICTIDEKLATNAPKPAAELSTKLGDYVKVTKRPMKCFKVASNGTRTPTGCEHTIIASVHTNDETKNKEIRVQQKAEIVVIKPQQTSGKVEANSIVTDVIDIADLNVDFSVFGLGGQARN